MSFNNDEPEILGSHGTEWIATQVVGLSFLLHQIRKMISVAVDLVRGAATIDTINQALDANNKLRLNVAPSQGLFLDMSMFDQYNRRLEERGAVNETSPQIDWCNSSSPAYQRWKAFKQDVVAKHVVQEEDEGGNFIKYLFVQEYVFGPKECYQNTDGDGSRLACTGATHSTTPSSLHLSIFSWVFRGNSSLDAKCTWECHRCLGRTRKLIYVHNQLRASEV
jgi:hypothetical protein